jgi:hypothetical protein
MVSAVMRPPLQLLGQGGVRGVVEGAKHPGHVGKRRKLEAAFAQGSRGLALEIDDQKILAGVQNLAEVIVAMNPSAHAGEARVGDGAEPLQYFRLERDDFIGLGAGGFREHFQARAEEAEALHGAVPHGLKKRALIERIERLGSEILVL